MIRTDNRPEQVPDGTHASWPAAELLVLCSNQTRLEVHVNLSFENLFQRSFCSESCESRLTRPKGLCSFTLEANSVTICRRPKPNPNQTEERVKLHGRLVPRQKLLSDKEYCRKEQVCQTLCTWAVHFTSQLTSGSVYQNFYSSLSLKSQPNTPVTEPGAHPNK